MNKSQQTYLQLSSLSTYRGIFSRSIVKAFYKLLSSINLEPCDFLNAYGEFYSLLCERGYSNNFSYCFTQTALFDDNCFTRAAAAGKAAALSQNVIEAVSRDLDIIIKASKISSEYILNDYKYKEQIKEITKNLPKWTIGKSVDVFETTKLNLNNLESFHKQNGCGMFARYKTFIWRNGAICPVVHPDKINIEDLEGYEYERNLVLNNTISFIENKSSNNCLLYGDKGTGKSTTVKAVFNMLKSRGLRIVEIPKERLMEFPLLVETIASIPMKFIIFIDDLSFQKQDESYASLKAVLEGGLTKKPDNALIYATSNRRHLIRETTDDNGGGNDLHPSDSKEERLSLSDRFGLAVLFSFPDRENYFKIVKALAKQSKLNIDEDTLLKNAERFALVRGGRSPRCAKQYIKSLFTN